MRYTVDEWQSFGMSEWAVTARELVCMVCERTRRVDWGHLFVAQALASPGNQSWQLRIHLGKNMHDLARVSTALIHRHTYTRTHAQLTRRRRTRATTALTGL